MKVVILCGGMGTRIRDVSELVPKPMVEIGGRPILWHVMKTYAHYGYKDFILCLGYKGETIKDYFLNYETRNTDFTIELGSNNRLQIHGNHTEQDWRITLANTGLETMTGGRLGKVKNYLADEDDFMLTYADGVADININELLAFHKQQNKMVTITAVHPSARFGEMCINGSTVQSFHEKPQTKSDYINGGFMVISREFLHKYIDDDPQLILEHQPLRRASRDSQMAAFQHEGFWQCMDTARERMMLEKLFIQGQAPWVVWSNRTNCPQESSLDASHKTNSKTGPRLDVSVRPRLSEVLPGR